jgi:hypothetical protein
MGGRSASEFGGTPMTITRAHTRFADLKLTAVGLTSFSLDG